MIDDIQGTDIVVADVSVVGQQEKSRFEALCQMARHQPRSIEVFRKRALDMCTLTEAIADQCLYALPRRGQGGERVNIEGPSIRMAEILLKAWKNAGVFAMVIDGDAEYVTAQATFVDFEDLTMVSKQQRRRVLGRHGDARMLAENAAISVATRNAILGAIPRALWNDAYEKAKATAAGTLETLEQRRNDAVKWLTSKGVNEERIFNALDVEGINDIGLDELATLRALVTQIRTGEMKAEDAFPKIQKDGAASDAKPARGVSGLKQKVAGAGAATETGQATDAGATAPAADKK